MDFGEIFPFLMAGKRVTNEAWNGRGMYIVMMEGYPEGVRVNPQTAEAHRIPKGSKVKVRPYIVMKDAQDQLVPWQPSQQDLFSKKWRVLCDCCQLPLKVFSEEVDAFKKLFTCPTLDAVILVSQ